METDTDGGTIGARAARRRRIRRPPFECQAPGSCFVVPSLHADGDISRMWFRFLRIPRYGTGTTFSWLTRKGRFWSEFRCIFFLWLTAAGPRVVTPSTTSQLWTTHRRAFAHCRLSREPPAHWDRWSTGNIMRHSYEFSVRLKKMKMSTFELKTKRAFSRFGPSLP